MHKLNRWIVRHTRLSKLIAAVIITALSFLLLNPNVMPFLMRYLIVFSSLFYGFLFINTAPERLIRGPLQILEEQCDPYPILEETSFLMEVGGNDKLTQIARINYAMALRQVGEFEKVLSILENISREQLDSAPELNRLVYANNMADVLSNLDRFDEAEIWYERTMDIYRNLPEGKIKESCRKPMMLSEAESLYRTGNYTDALRKVSAIPCQTRRFLMDATLLAARCDLALNQPEKATEKLNYIIANGNKLYCVEQAKRMLAD